MLIGRDFGSTQMASTSALLSELSDENAASQRRQNEEGQVSKD